MSTATKTATAIVELRAGDLVALRDIPIGIAQGRVFDIIGDVARVWWVDSGLSEACVEGLAPVPVVTLRLLKRPAAYAAVRFTGTDTEPPYGFVVVDDRIDAVRSMINVFETADRYEVIGHNVDVDNDEMKDETTDGDTEG